MDDEKLDEFIRKFHQEIKQDSIELYGKNFYERWQNPRYMDAMAQPDVMALLKGSCGDSMLFFLKFENGVVSEATYKTDGCAPSIVCGSYAAELALGKRPEELLKIDADMIIDRIGDLPEQVRHCASLAAGTIHKAVDKYLIEHAGKNRNPSS